MNRRDLTRTAADMLRKNNARKTITIPRQVLHISDDNGVQKDFIVRRKDKDILYTIDDVNVILEALITVIKESLKAGDEVSIHGFGTFGLKYRMPRSTKSVNTNDPITIAGHFIPKFTFGKDLKMCAKIYEMHFDDRMNDPEPLTDEQILAEMEEYEDSDDSEDIAEDEQAVE